MEEQLEPLMLTLRPQAQLGYIFIKTNGHHLLATMEAVKQQMAALEPGQDFTGSFVGDNVQNWYTQEKIMAILFSIAAVVAIVLSCSGLLGDGIIGYPHPGKGNRCAQSPGCLGPQYRPADFA